MIAKQVSLNAPVAIHMVENDASTFVGVKQLIIFKGLENKHRKIRCRYIIVKALPIFILSYVSLIYLLLRP